MLVSAHLKFCIIKVKPVNPAVAFFLHTQRLRFGDGNHELQLRMVRKMRGRAEYVVTRER